MAEGEQQDVPIAKTCTDNSVSCSEMLRPTDLDTVGQLLDDFLKAKANFILKDAQNFNLTDFDRLKFFQIASVKLNTCLTSAQGKSLIDLVNNTSEERVKCLELRKHLDNYTSVGAKYAKEPLNFLLPYTYALGQLYDKKVFAAFLDEKAKDAFFVSILDNNNFVTLVREAIEILTALELDPTWSEDLSADELADKMDPIIDKVTHILKTLNRLALRYTLKNNA